MKRLQKYVLAIATLAALGACSKANKEASSANEQLAADQGHQAAMEATQQKPGSMEREKAILKIRATEEKILQTGDTAAARAYVGAAEAVLDSIL